MANEIDISTVAHTRITSLLPCLSLLTSVSDNPLLRPKVIGDVKKQSLDHGRIEQSGGVILASALERLEELGALYITDNYIPGASDSSLPSRSIPSLKLQSTSSPEILCPFASTTLKDIIFLTHCLELTWYDLRPGDGLMRAEGNGYTFNSAMLWLLGVLLHFTHNDATQKQKPWRDM
ncbi:hypothetical protein MMC29_007046 [Sticta canariensis]|nr:hypothetical protein [Sticta canariensis]